MPSLQKTSEAIATCDTVAGLTHLPAVSVVSTDASVPSEPQPQPPPPSALPTPSSSTPVVLGHQR